MNVEMRYVGEMCGAPFYVSVSHLRTEEEKTRKVLEIKSLFDRGVPDPGKETK